MAKASASSLCIEIYNIEDQRLKNTYEFSNLSISIWEMYEYTGFCETGFPRNSQTGVPMKAATALI